MNMFFDKQVTNLDANAFDGVCVGRKTHAGKPSVMGKALQYEGARYFIT